MEPVSITFQTNAKDLEQACSQATDAILGVNSAGERAVNTLRTQIKEQKNVIKIVEGDIKELATRVSKMAPGREHQELVADLNAAKTVLLEEKDALKLLEGELDKAAEASKRLSASKRALMEDMARLKIAGQGESAEFQELARQVTVIDAATKEVNKEIATLGKSDGIFEGLVQGMAGIAGAMAAGEGAMALFGGESENLEEIQTRLQGIMAVAIGLQETYNAVQEQSAFMVRIVTGAKKLWTTAQTALNVQLGISVGLSKALMISGIGVLIAGITALVLWYQKWSEEQEEINRLQNEYRAIEIDTARSMAKQKVEVESLIRLAKDETQSLETRNSAIKRLNDLMPTYNAYLSAEGKLISGNENALKDYLDRLYAIEKAKKLMARSEELQEQADVKKAEAPQELSLWEKAGSYTTSLFSSKSVDEIQADIKKKYQEQRDAEVKAILEEKAKTDAKIDELVKGDKNKSVFEGVFGADNQHKETITDNTNKVLTEAQRARDRLAQVAVDSENKVNALVIAAMENGSAKRLKEIEAEYDTEIDTVDKKLKEIEALEEKARADGKYSNTDQANADRARDELNAVKDAARTKRDAEIQAEEEAAARAVKQVWDDVRDEFQSDLQRELSAIDRSYKERKQIIIENVTDAVEQEAQIKALGIEKVRAMDVANVQNKLKEVGVRRDIEIEKQNLINKTHLFETDKIAALLQIERDATEEELALYQQLQSEGVQGLEDEIELLITKIAAMNAELAKMPVEKIREGLSTFQSITGALAGMGGEAGEMFSSISASVDTLNTALSETATTQDKLTGAASSIASIIDTISAANSRRKQTESEFYKNALAFAHEYALSLNEQIRLQSEAAGGGFVTNYAGKIDDGFKAIQDATKKHEEAMAKLNQGKANINLRSEIDWGATAKTALAGAGAGAAIGSLIVPVIGTAVGAAIGGAVGFFAGIFGATKKEVVKDGLLDVFPELVDGAGNLNKELAQSLINTEQVDEATRQLLQDSLDWADAVEEANQQIKDVVTDLAGDLGNSLKDAIVGAWVEGKDASTAMFEAASKSLQSFVEDLLYSAIFSDVFADFSDRLTESLKPTGDGDVVDDYDWLMNEMDKRDDVYVAQMDALKKRASQRGYNMWMPEAEPEVVDTAKQTVQKGAFSTLSQEDGGLILGQIAAGNVHINSMHELLSSWRQEDKVTYSTLAAIEKNTFDTATELKDINKRLKQAASDGIKIK